MRQKVYTHNAQENQSSGRSCVVLVTASQQCPGQLLSALARRRFHIHFATCPSDVFTHLASQSVSALVLIDPTADTSTRQLVAALKRYFPNTACWQYQLTTNNKDQLAIYDPDAKPAPTPQSVPAAAPAPQSKQPIPVSPEPAPNTAATPQEAPQTEISPQPTNKPNPIDSPLRITQEELDMLLGPLPDPDEDFDDGL